MIIGATKENDYQLLSTSQLLYQQYDLKRVFYSAYIPVNEDSALPSRETKPPLLREHRLYQADWLLRFYGFGAGELLDEKKMTIKVLRTNDIWYGMTYKEDVEAVKESFKGMIEVGVYEKDLFGDL